MLIEIEEISKKISLWLYILTNVLEEQEEEIKEKLMQDHEIHSKKAKRMMIYMISPAHDFVHIRLIFISFHMIR